MTYPVAPVTEDHDRLIWVALEAEALSEPGAAGSVIDVASVLLDEFPPEFDDCTKLAAAHNLPVKEVQAIANKAYKS